MKLLRISNIFKITLFCSFLSLAASTVFSQNIIVAPNPWIPEDGKEKTGNLTDGIRFINIPSDGEILIFTIGGSLVKRIVVSGNTSGEERWLGKNDDDQYVASGVYLWLLKSPSFVKSGKLIIIR